MQLKFAWLLCLSIALSPSLAQAKARKKPPAAPTAHAARAGELVPASATAAVLLEGPHAADGVIAFLGTAAQAAPSLAPRLVAQDLARALGVDPLTPSVESGVSAEGPRAIVLDARAMGFSAPVADEARAKQQLQAWLAQLGPVRPTRGAPLKGPSASGGGDQVRAGMIAPVAGSLRWLSASGRGAAALVSQLAHVGSKAQDTVPLVSTPTISAALGAALGPVRVWSRGEGPVVGTLLALDASQTGLVGHGLIIAASGSPALLDGNAPPESACEGQPLFCVRAAPGPALRALAPLFARELIGRGLLGLLGSQRDALDTLIQGGLAEARGPALLRIEGLHARALSEPDSLLAAMPSSLASGSSATPLALPEKLPAPWTALQGPRNGVMLSQQAQLCIQSQAAEQPGALWLSSPCAPLPAHLNEEGGGKELAARLDTQGLARALGPLGALDALRGSLSAGAVAIKLLWGELLARSGPVDVTARPTAQTDPVLSGSLDLNLAWPLSLAPTAK